MIRRVILLKILFIIMGLVVVYFSIRIIIGNKKSRFYGDSLTKSSLRDEAYEKSVNPVNASKGNTSDPGHGN
jgi:hypothetical protein